MSKARTILDGLTDRASYVLSAMKPGQRKLERGWIDGFLAMAEEDGDCTEFEYDQLLPNGGVEFSWYMDTYLLSPEDWAYLKFQLKFRFPGVTFKQSEE